MQILAALRLGDVAEADLLQQFLGQVQRYVGAGGLHLRGGGLFLPLLFQPHLFHCVRMKNGIKKCCK